MCANNSYPIHFLSLEGKFSAALIWLESLCRNEEEQLALKTPHDSHYSRTVTDAARATVRITEGVARQVT